LKDLEIIVSVKPVLWLSLLPSLQGLSTLRPLLTLELMQVIAITEDYISSLPTFAVGFRLSLQAYHRGTASLTFTSQLSTFYFIHLCIYP